jgi:hypothetical protein
VIKLPILVNEREVGRIIITRQRTAGVGSNEEWRHQRYRWEARLTDHVYADRGEVQHKPEEGIYRLIEKVCRAVHNPAMEREMKV